MDHSIQTLWHDLTTAALLGSERRTIAVPTLGGSLGEALRGLQAQAADPEETLLAMAALISIYRRAGTGTLADLEPIPAPGPDDEQPAISDRSSGHLQAMLSGPNSAALPEWLAEAGRLGRRVRDSDLVAVLEYASSRPACREAILPVIGRRGRWLASRNPDWRFAAGEIEPADTDWQTGTREQRLAFLKTLRTSDPSRARAIAASTWDQETPSDRAAILGAFAAGLSMEDEPFLEAALDDTRAEVRRTAAHLLGQLSASVLCQRMIERLQSLVRFCERDGTLTVNVTLPEAHSRDLARDGIARTVPGMGEKHGQLRQMIALVPPNHWSESTGRSPAELLKLVQGTEWDDVLGEGWCEAAERHRDQVWLQSIALRDLEQDDLNRLRRALALIDRPRRERLLIDLLASGRPLVGYHLHLVAEAVPGPWDTGFSREIIDRVLQRLQAERFPDPGVTSTLRLAGFAVDPSLKEELAGLFALDDPYWPPLLLKPIQEFLAAVRFRHEALSELRS